MKIALTGGHLAPALAVIQHIPKKAEIIYIGRKHAFEGDAGFSLEYQIISEKKIPFIELATGRLQRKLTRHTLSSLAKFPFGVQQAVKILQKEKPDIVLGFGGYISLSVGIAATLLHIPLVIHEQTFRAGLSNKFLAKFAKKVAISWEESAKYFPKEKTVLIGNPHVESTPTKKIQELIATLPNKPILFITGGSAGSHAVNEMIEKILLQLLENYVVIHQTGDAKEFGDYDRLQEEVKKLSQEQQKNYHCMKFVDPSDFDYLVRNADLVIGRAGINTVTSLLIEQKRALLIPLISGQKNEQATNAKFFKSIGLAKVIDQTTSSDALLHTIQEMIQKKNEFTPSKSEEQYKRHVQAALHLVELLYVVYQANSSKKI